MNNVVHPITEINGDTDVCYEYLIDTNEQTHDKTGEDVKFTKQLMEYFDVTGISYRQMDLPVDYFLNRGIGDAWEMKDMNDFVGSWLKKDKNGKPHIINQMNEMTDSKSFNLDIRRSLIIRDGLNLALEENYTLDANGDPKIERTLFSTRAKIKQNRKAVENWKWKRVRVNPNAFLGMLLEVQQYMPVVLLGGYQHTFDYFRARLDRAKKDESKLQNGTMGVRRMVAVPRDAEDWEIQRMMIEALPGIGSSNSDALLRHYTTPRAFFTQVRSLDDLRPCTRRLDGMVDKNIETFGPRLLTLLDTPYSPPEKPKKNNNT